MNPSVKGLERDTSAGPATPPIEAAAPPTSFEAPAKLPSRPRRAFTLIELLVVIAIMGILASLTFGVVRGAKNAQKRARAKAEVAQVVSVIESYKVRLGQYPPSNPGNIETNTLFYELTGVKPDGENAFVSKFDDSRFPRTDVVQAFGIAGFQNHFDPERVENFFPSLKASSIALIPGLRVKALAIPVEGPLGAGKPNWMRYNSSNPTNNPGAFDVWFEIIINGKPEKIGNW